MHSGDLLQKAICAGGRGEQDDLEAETEEPPSPDVRAGARLHDYTAAPTLRPEALELRVGEPMALGDAVIRVGHGHLEDALGQIDGDGYGVQVDSSSLGVPTRATKLAFCGREESIPSLHMDEWPGMITCAPLISAHGPSPVNATPVSGSPTS